MDLDDAVALLAGTSLIDAESQLGQARTVVLAALKRHEEPEAPLDAVARQLWEWGRVGSGDWDDMVPRGRQLYRDRARILAELLTPAETDEVRTEWGVRWPDGEVETDSDEPGYGDEGYARRTARMHADAVLVSREVRTWRTAWEETS